MTNLVKQEIDTRGFVQIVEGNARFWQNTVSSLLDHCWTNCGHRILKNCNITRGSSDHNLQEFVIRIAGSDNKPKQILTRDRSNMNLERYKMEVANIDWTEFFQTNDLNVANYIFETKIRQILDREAPLISRQMKMKHKSWIISETRRIMKVRDTARDLAVRSQMNSDWNKYRLLRNKCTVMAKQDKMKHYKDLFGKHEGGKYISRLYNKVKFQLGWNSSGPPQTLIINGKPTSSTRRMTQEQMELFHKIRKMMQQLPISGDSPTANLEEAIRKWGPRSNQRTLFEFKQITLSETANILKSLGNGE